MSEHRENGLTVPTPNERRPALKESLPLWACGRVVWNLRPNKPVAAIVEESARHSVFRSQSGRRHLFGEKLFHLRIACPVFPSRIKLLGHLTSPSHPWSTPTPARTSDSPPAAPHSTP